MDMESAVSEGYAEETAFEFLVCLLMPYRFLSAFLRQLTFPLLALPLMKAVVFGFEVWGQTYFGLFVSLPK